MMRLSAMIYDIIHFPCKLYKTPTKINKISPANCDNENVALIHEKLIKELERTDTRVQTKTIFIQDKQCESDLLSKYLKGYRCGNIF